MLIREWDENLPRTDFIMLNPSTADEYEDDATIRKCISYAKSWGCGSVRVMNLFAIRATNPKYIYNSVDPVGNYNDWWLEGCPDIPEPSINPKYVICAWGNHGQHMGRSQKVYNILRDQYHESIICHLKLNKNGEPAHPLYLKKDLKPKIYLRGLYFNHSKGI